MLRSTAAVDTDAPVRYAKQLLAHLGRKTTVEPLDGEPDGGRLVFADGNGTVRPADGQLILVAEARADGQLGHRGLKGLRNLRKIRGEDTQDLAAFHRRRVYQRLLRLDHNAVLIG